MGEPVAIIDKRHRAPAEQEYVTERVAIDRQAFEDFARHGRADRRPRPIQVTEAQRKAAQRQWAEQAAATLWWEAQRAATPEKAAAILAKRDELLTAVQEDLGEVWV